MPTQKEPLVWVLAQLNNHIINQDDKDTYKFREYDAMYDDEWFNSFRLELIME